MLSVTSLCLVCSYFLSRLHSYMLSLILYFVLQIVVCTSRCATQRDGAARSPRGSAPTEGEQIRFRCLLYLGAQARHLYTQVRSHTIAAGPTCLLHLSPSVFFELPLVGQNQSTELCLTKACNDTAVASFFSSSSSLSLLWWKHCTLTIQAIAVSNLALVLSSFLLKEVCRLPLTQQRFFLLPGGVCLGYAVSCSKTWTCNGFQSLSLGVSTSATMVLCKD